MEHFDLIRQFTQDLQIDGCVVQVGTLQKVIGNLTPQNLNELLGKLEGKDAFFLGGVRADAVGRAHDHDIKKKNYWYMDFDIRNWWKEKHDEDLSDGILKEIAADVLDSLNKHQTLMNWRCAVLTGNGMHVYYFGDSIEVHSTERFKGGITLLLKEAENCTQVPPDYGCINAARIARLPGSQNYKNNRQIPVEIFEFRAEKNFDMKLIEQSGKQLVASVPDPKKSSGESEIGGIIEGKRDNTLASLAGSLHHRGHSEETILHALRAVNANQCRPPLPDSDLRRIAKSISKYPDSHEKDGEYNTPVLLNLEDVVPEQVQWLWSNRLPRGKITIIEGDPGNGKSWCSLAIACAVTRGNALPGDTQTFTPANVLLMTAEDGAADTIRPRLEVMGADLSKVKILTGVRDAQGEEHHPSLTNDIPSIEKALKQGGYALVVIDPINAYLPGIDTNNDAALRAVFNPLAQLAEKHGVAIVCIRHLTKSAREKSIYRGQGSIAYTAAARVVHVVGVNPNNKRERVIICIKNNLALPTKGRIFEMNEGRFLWGDETDISADLLLGSDPNSNEGGALEEAKNFLCVTLFEGAKHSKEVEVEADDAGISKSTLKRARIALGIKSKREGGRDGIWLWELPEMLKETKNTNAESWSSLKPKEDDPQLPIPTDA